MQNKSVSMVWINIVIFAFITSLILQLRWTDHFYANLLSDCWSHHSTAIISLLLIRDHKGHAVEPVIVVRKCRSSFWCYFVGHFADWFNPSKQCQAVCQVLTCNRHCHCRIVALFLSTDMLACVSRMRTLSADKTCRTFGWCWLSILVGWQCWPKTVWCTVWSADSDGPCGTALRGPKSTTGGPHGTIK